MMATTAALAAASDDRFFLKAAIVMALIVVTGFSTQLFMGRSTFSSPLHVHIHAVVFMGWIVIYVAQNAFAATGSMVLHKRLGWIATGWMVAMVVLGILVTVVMVRQGTVPFFFTPLHFLVFDPVTVLTFAGLTTAAVVNRRRTDWHRRLHFCGMAVLLAPAFGRLLPLPLLTPFAWEVTSLAALAVPIIAVILEYRRTSSVHRAWGAGIATIIGALILTEAITYGPLGSPLYRAVTAGSPGASIAPLEFPPPPTGPLITGRPASI